MTAEFCTYQPSAGADLSALCTECDHVLRSHAGLPACLMCQMLALLYDPALMEPVVAPLIASMLRDRTLDLHADRMGEVHCRRPVALPPHLRAQV